MKSIDEVLMDFLLTKGPEPQTRLKNSLYEHLKLKAAIYAKDTDELERINLFLAITFDRKIKLK